MPLIPTMRLVLLALAPLVLGAAMTVDSTLLRPMLAVDAGLVLLALIDGLLASGRLMVVAREAPSVLSVGRANLVTLRIRSRARRQLDVTVTDDRPVGVTIPDLPARATVAARGRANVVYHLNPSRRGAIELGRASCRERV